MGIHGKLAVFADRVSDDVWQAIYEKLVNVATQWTLVGASRHLPLTSRNRIQSFWPVPTVQDRVRLWRMALLRGSTGARGLRGCALRGGATCAAVFAAVVVVECRITCSRPATRRVT